MRFIQIPLPQNFPKRWPTVYASRMARVNAFGTHTDRADYIKKNGSWGLLKKWLANVSGDKCWYCEAKSTRAPFDVDHFRPKLGVTVDGVKLAGHNGYHWLAYEWWNFRLSCQRCNRPENDDVDVLYGKANEFPIRDEVHRCMGPAGQLDAESPRLLDPCVQADCELLAHGIDGEVKPNAQHGSWEYDRARYTIEQLGFNEWNTPEAKKNSWRILDDLIRLAGNQPTVLTHLREHLSVDHEYSSFFRSAIGTHRDKAWVENLL
ncbi:hypothetical protein [Chromobacterium violaceum]|uniref:hypothetical protein n=1 Tax=Chromobacterium violaceum TaxID=536 RepID=UPI001B3415E2|nr:hypothetical protein [Chromobacterium violaceum]MBP4047757.1 hypothetical protein [Chromobacterium violaceum]